MVKRFGCPRVALVAVGVAVAAACTSAESASLDVAPATTASTAAPTTLVSTTTSTTTTTTSVAPPLDHDGTARALVTPTDVVLPVLAASDDGWVVRTPCQALALVTGGTTVDRVHVVLDPGHGGGSEPGAVTDTGLTEASVNLAVSELAAAKLERLGFEVLLTRYRDVRMPILTRVEIADRLEAPLLVSVHHQGLGDVPLSPEPGTEVYYRRESSESRRFAGLLREEAVEELGRFDIEWFAGPDAGATYRLDARSGEDFYGMVRRPSSVAVLAELSFMGNPAEAALMETRSFLDAEAQAITDAVERWFTSEDPGADFVEPSFAITSSGGGGGLGGCEDPDLGPTLPVRTAVAESLGELGESG